VAAELTFIENADLTRLNTLGLPARARFLAKVSSDAALLHVLRSVTAQRMPVEILGGGSNLVLAGNVPALVIQPCLMGRQVLSTHGDTVLVEAGAGENWHAFTQWTIAQGLSGLENLSLIPGSVGASPVQNIGAYGVEVADVMHSLTAIDRLTGARVELAAAACAFAYRDSLFKSRAPGRYIITKVRFLLSRKPTIRLDYGDIRREIERLGIVQVTPRAVANAVIAIRQSKLPDPTKLGNAGSFFKNPVVPVTQADDLRQRFPGLVSYPQPVGVKLAAGWLIEQAGWKGRNQGAVGVHDRQALVLIHRGGGSGAQLLQLAADVRASVLDKFGVVLEQEPVIWGL